jgi:hypothetical protein
MSGIRWKPKYTVLAKSPETFKRPLTSFRAGRLQTCCIPFITNILKLTKTFDGGTPSLGGSLIKNGGSSTSSGPIIYSGGGTI